MKHPVTKALEEAAELFEDRTKDYGEAYKAFGKVMVEMIPVSKRPLVLKDERDFNRMGIFVHIINKVMRYAYNFENGGHEDSLTDLSVYAQMLAQIDKEGKDTP